MIFSIALSTASIVLAVVAIQLGRSSEQAMIQRSDDSTARSHEIFAKTVEALESIKSSTGVTEKRIEDIIAGRAGELSSVIAERLGEKRGGGEELDANAIQQMLRETLASHTPQSASERDDVEEKRKELAERRRRQEEIYESMHQSLLEAISQQGGVRAIKAGHGTPSQSQKGTIDGIDAVFRQGNTLIGLSTFRPSMRKPDQEQANSLVSSLIQPIHSGIISTLFIVFFEPASGDLSNTFAKALSTVKDEIANKVKIIQLSKNDISSWAAETFGNDATGSTDA